MKKLFSLLLLSLLVFSPAKFAMAEDIIITPKLTENRVGDTVHIECNYNGNVKEDSYTLYADVPIHLKIEGVELNGEAMPLEKISITPTHTRIIIPSVKTKNINLKLGVTVTDDTPINKNSSVMVAFRDDVTGTHLQDTWYRATIRRVEPKELG